MDRVKSGVKNVAVLPQKRFFYTRFADTRKTMILHTFLNESAFFTDCVYSYTRILFTDARKKKYGGFS